VRAVNTGTAQLVNDTRQDPDYIPGKGEEAYLSELVVPIIKDGKVIAVFNIENQEPNAFIEMDKQILELLALDIASELTRVEQMNQLGEQNVRLMELDELKSRFIATATHELRTPVTSILGFLELVLDYSSQVLPDSVRKDLNVVFRNANRLKTLTNNLLDLQRIQTGRLEMYPKEFDLIKLMNQVIEELTPLLHEKNHQILLDAPEILIILGDETYISQLLTNLLRNANKFTPEEGKISLNVEAHGDRIQVTIKDTGIGMDPGDMDRLFKPFPGINHGLNVTSSGLGLCICKGIVDLHNGSIWAESEGKGYGTKFIVELPL